MAANARRGEVHAHVKRQCSADLKKGSARNASRRSPGRRVSMCDVRSPCWRFVGCINGLPRSGRTSLNHNDRNWRALLTRRSATGRTHNPTFVMGKAPPNIGHSVMRRFVAGTGLFADRRVSSKETRIADVRLDRRSSRLHATCAIIPPRKNRRRPGRRPSRFSLRDGHSSGSFGLWAVGIVVVIGQRYRAADDCSRGQHADDDGRSKLRLVTAPGARAELAAQSNRQL